MELLFGSHVRSGGRRVGYLAGVEVDAASRRVTKIVFSDDGKLGSHPHMQSIEGVSVDRGALVIKDAAPGARAPVAAEPVLVSRSVRVMRDGRPTWHVAGVVVGEHGSMEGAIARPHWWSGRQRLAATELDLPRPLRPTTS